MSAAATWRPLAGAHRRLALAHELRGQWEAALAARETAASVLRPRACGTRRPPTGSRSPPTCARRRATPRPWPRSAPCAATREASGRKDLLLRAEGLRGNVLSRLGNPARASRLSGRRWTQALHAQLTDTAAELQQRLADSLEHSGDYQAATAAYGAAYQYCDELGKRRRWAAVPRLRHRGAVHPGRVGPGRRRLRRRARRRRRAARARRGRLLARPDQRPARRRRNGPGAPARCQRAQHADRAHRGGAVVGLGAGRARGPGRRPHRGDRPAPAGARPGAPNAGAALLRAGAAVDRHVLRPSTASRTTPTPARPPCRRSARPPRSPKPSRPSPTPSARPCCRTTPRRRLASCGGPPGCSTISVFRSPPRSRRTGPPSRPWPSGDTAAARQLLQTACHTAERLGARPLLDDCAAALDGDGRGGGGGDRAGQKR